MGEAAAIPAVTTATAEGLRQVTAVLRLDGGGAAMKLRIAEDCVQQLGNLAKAANTLVVPANLSDISSMIALATSIVGQQNGAAGENRS